MRDAFGVPVAAPEAAGIPSGAVLEFVDAVERAGLDPHSLILARRDTVAAAGWWHPYGPDEIALLYSLSKSFTSTAIGFAEAEGLVELDRPLADYFPEAAARAHPRSRDILVRHLLSMATGHQTDTLDRLDPADPVGSFLALPPDAAPGTLFTYNNGATLMLSAIITQLTGRRMLDYLRPRLWRPLGVDRAYWDHPFAPDGGRPGAASGPDLGFSGLRLSTGAIAKFGLTYLSGGSFRGRQVLPPGWVDRATAVHINTADRHNTPDWQQGYGFQFWRARHGYRGDGAFGQFCMVLPEQQAVLAATSATEDLHGYVSLVWRILLPAMADRPLRADPGAAQALAGRLTRLSLPNPPVSDGDGPPAAPATLRLTGEPARTLALTGARLERAGEGWRLTLTDAGREYPLPCRPEGFTRSEHGIGDEVLVLASAGGWDSDRRFVADVVLLNTPHRFRLTAEPAAGTSVTGAAAVTAWHTAPLHDQPLVNHALPRDVGVA